METYKVKVKKLIIENLEKDFPLKKKKSKREIDHLIDMIFSSSEKETYQRIQ